MLSAPAVGELGEVPLGLLDHQVHVGEAAVVVDDVGDVGHHLAGRT